MNSIRSLEIAQMEEPEHDIKRILSDINLNIIKEVKVNVEVRVGQAEITVDQLLNLGQGSIIQLSRPTTAPVDLLIDSKIVARGFLVAADDNFGIQITELKS